MSRRNLLAALTWCLASFVCENLTLAHARGATPTIGTASELKIQVAPRTLRSDEVTLLWDKPWDAGRDMTYEISCDGQSVAKTSKTYFTLTGLAPERSHGMTVTVNSPKRGSAATGTVKVTTPAKETVLSIEKFGAVGDGKTLNTKAIQSAIDACPKDGIVAIPKGEFLSGALYLKSDLTLSIESGGVLKGSLNPEDYEPFIKNRFEGWEMETYASLINAGRLDSKGPPTLHNLSLRGKGKILGGGTPLGKTMIAAHGLRSRGRLLCLMNCENVEIQGLTLEDSPCWTLHYIYSENVSCHDLNIISTARNGDGLDPDSSRNSYIFNCTFSTGDDCIAIKSGKNPDGNVVNRPTEGVQIIDCTFTKGHGISIGSETSGGVRDILVQDCVAGALIYGMQIKSTKDRGNVVENVLVRDCDLQKITVLTALNYNNDGAPAPEPPFFRNFRFINIDLSTGKPASPVIIVEGFEAKDHRTKNLQFENITLPEGAIVKVDQSEKVNFTKVATLKGEKPTFQVTRSDDITY